MKIILKPSQNHANTSIFKSKSLKLYQNQSQIKGIASKWHRNHKQCNLTKNMNIILKTTGKHAKPIIHKEHNNCMKITEKIMKSASTSFWKRGSCIKLITESWQLRSKHFKIINMTSINRNHTTQIMKTPPVLLKWARRSPKWNINQNGSRSLTK